MIYGNKFLSENNIYNSIEEMLTAEKIIELSKQFNESEVSLSEFGIKIPNIGSMLINDFARFGITGKSLNEIRIAAGKTTANIVELVKTHGASKDIFGLVSTEFNNFIRDVSGIIRAGIKIPELDIKDEYDFNKVLRACYLVLVCITLNELSASILNVFVDPLTAQMTTVVIIGPINEEMCKKVAIEAGCGAEFAILFNLCEFAMYMKKFNNAVSQLPKEIAKAILITLAKARLAVVGMHLTTMLINAISSNPTFRKLFNIDEQDKDKASFIGFIAGLLIHGTWNFMAMNSKSFNKLLMGL